MRRRKRSNYGAYREKKRVNVQIFTEVLSWVFSILVVLMIAYVLAYFAGERTSNIGDSMSPTLENDDKVLIDRFIYRVKSPKKGDIIVFKPNGNKNTHFYIKRIVGEPGDTVQIINGFMYINGELAADTLFGQIQNAGIASDPITLGEDEYFVMGDNPNSSEDSRYADIGNVHLNDIEGKAWYVLTKERRGRLK